MRHLLLITTLLFAGAAGATKVEPVEHVYQARAHVTPAGTVEAVEPQEGMIPQVAALVTDAVQATTFTPATVNGEPAASKTTVWVKIRFEGVEGDATGTQLAARVLDVSQRNPYMRPGHFPQEALVNEISALIWLELALLPDGRVDPDNSRILQADIRGSGGQKLKRSRGGVELQKTALATALTWRMFPEEVDGVARATRLVTNISYCVGGSRSGKDGCPRFDPGPAELPRAAVDANVKLARLAELSSVPET